MKKRLKAAAIIFAGGLFMFSAAVCQAQMMVGNFREAAKNDRDVIGAANFAVAEHSKMTKPAVGLVSVEKAEKQVVAGTNYRLCLTVKAGNTSAQASAIVYENLQNQYKLMSWTSENCAVGKTNATSTAVTDAPDVVVKNLYAADKADKSPFFQTENRGLVDKYFTKDFADMIWNDAVNSKEEVGAIDGNPLYNSQDRKITAFVIGKPEYDPNGGSGMATVLVSFRNFGKPETVKYLFAQDAAKNWKITDIVFKNGDMLKGILFDSQRPSN